jgi:hypothetical protein
LDLHVDLPDSSYTLVPEGGDEGADGELQHVSIAQGLNPSPEGPKANLASEGKPRMSYGPPWAHYLGGCQDRLLGGPLGLTDLCRTVPDGVRCKDHDGEVLG